MEASQDGYFLICNRFFRQKARWMKKFVLHCNRWTVVTRSFNLSFVHIKKKGTLGTRLISQKFLFLSEPANFSASDRLGRNFRTVHNGFEKRKNLCLIKLLSKWKMAIRKEHTSFLLFHFWDLKLVPIDSALNLLQVTCLIFFKNVGVVPRKAAKLENPVKIFLKCLCDL